MYITTLNSLKTAKQKYGDIISSKEMDMLLESDISNTYKYIEWLCNVYVNEDVIVPREQIEQFDLAVQRNKVKQKDINRYTYDDFKDLIENLDFTESGKGKFTVEDVSKAKEEIKVFYEDERLFIFRPLSHLASRYYGSDDWCTSYKSPFNWGRYSGLNLAFFYIIDKKYPKEHPLHKVALAIDPSTRVPDRDRSHLDRTLELTRTRGMFDPITKRVVKLKDKNYSAKDMLLSNGLMAQTYDQNNQRISTKQYLDHIGKSEDFLIKNIQDIPFMSHYERMDKLNLTDKEKKVMRMQYDLILISQNMKMFGFL